MTFYQDDFDESRIPWVSFSDSSLTKSSFDADLLMIFSVKRAYCLFHGDSRYRSFVRDGHYPLIFILIALFKADRRYDYSFIGIANIYIDPLDMQNNFWSYFEYYDWLEYRHYINYEACGTGVWD